MTTLRIPEEQCPKCGNWVKVRPKARGQWTCPYCDQPVQFGVSNSKERKGLIRGLSGKQIVANVACALIPIACLVISFLPSRSLIEPVEDLVPSQKIAVLPEIEANQIQSAEKEYTLGLAYAKGDGVPQDWMEAIKYYRKAADRGYAKAQLNLGICYASGEGGIPQDLREAAKWFDKVAEQNEPELQVFIGSLYGNGGFGKTYHAEAVKFYLKAGEQGNVRAQRQLSEAYASGNGVTMDKRESLKWQLKAADQGDVYSQFMLGTMYKFGTGILNKDEEESLKWYRKAADQGNPEAQVQVGEAYHFGSGVPKDHSQSLFWFLKAANQGSADAQYNVGSCYSQGKGVPENRIEAYKWFSLAYASSDEEIGEERKTKIRKYGRLLNSWERGEAQRLVNEFKPVKARTTRR